MNATDERTANEQYHLEYAKHLADTGQIGEGKSVHLSYVGQCIRCQRNLNSLTVVELELPRVTQSGYTYRAVAPFCAACARGMGDQADPGSP